jgi:hypothetical protein
MFCSPVDSKFSENIVYGGYITWLARIQKDNLDAVLESLNV